MTTESPLELIASSDEMRFFDKCAIEAGTPSFALMERAGIGIFHLIKEAYSLVSGDRIAVFCGPGNNGGDGLVIARLAVKEGIKADLFLVPSERYSEDLLREVELFKGVGGTPTKILPDGFPNYKIVVDALLGTGQRGAPKAPICDFIRTLSGLCSPVISVDVPTGVDCDTGSVFDPCVKPAMTVCVQLVKRGLLSEPSRTIAGEIRVIDIGIKVESTEFRVSNDSLIQILPKRKADCHKGELGKVLIIAGSESFPGAAVLSSLGALRSGAGLVTCFVGRNFRSNFPPEAILLPSNDSKCVTLTSLEELLTKTEMSDAVVLGPGLGATPETSEFVMAFLAKNTKPTVIDADGLNVLASTSAGGTYPNAVLTPHPGEMSRLLGKSVEEIQKDRFSSVKSLAQKYGCTALLKGPGTLVYDGKNGLLNPTGTPFLATPGSGDILSGIIGTFLAQGLCPLYAASLGAFVHGRAGERASKRLFGRIIASDLAYEIPGILGPF